MDNEHHDDRNIIFSMKFVEVEKYLVLDETLCYLYHTTVSYDFICLKMLPGPAGVESRKSLIRGYKGVNDSQHHWKDIYLGIHTPR